MINPFTLKIDSSRVFGLDILRAVAILFVVIEHGTYLLPMELKALSGYLVFDGVSIFFVLSGFLIGGILIKIIDTKDFTIRELKNFWIRRWYRTLPNYFLVLSVLTILHYLFTANFSLHNIASFYYFSQNLWDPHPTYFFPEAWSLSIEEWFYLLVPLTVLIILRITKASPNKVIFYVSTFFIVFVTIFRWIRYNDITITSYVEWDLYFRKQVITRLDSLMFGVIGAYISYYFGSIWKTQRLISFYIGIVLIVASRFIFPKLFGINSLYQCVFSFWTMSFATLLLLPYLTSVRYTKGFFYKIITYISLASYSMYLINFSIIQRWIINNIDWQILGFSNFYTSIVKYLFYWSATISISILLYKYFEVPIMKLRDYSFDLRNVVVNFIHKPLIFFKIWRR